MSDFKKLIGSRIKAARKLKGITQEELAEQLHVSVSCISRCETGTAMSSVENLLRIAEVLGVGVEYLLYDYMTDHAVMDALTSEITLYVSPMPDSFKEHVLCSVRSLAQLVPHQDSP